MFVFLKTKDRQHDFVVQEIVSRGKTIMVNSVDSNFLVVNIPEFQDKTDERKNLEQEFLGINGVLKISIASRYLNVNDTTLIDAVKSRTCRIFFDVDSTLTQGQPGTLHPIVEGIFENLRRKKIHVYLITGRSMSKLLELTQKLPVSENCIAENGGIILGFPPKNYYEFGAITEPKKS